MLIEDISDVLIDGETRRVHHRSAGTEGGDAVVAQSENRTGFDRPTEPLPAIVPRHDGELGLRVVAYGLDIRHCKRVSAGVENAETTPAGSADGTLWRQRLVPGGNAAGIVLQGRAVEGKNGSDVVWTHEPQLAVLTTAISQHAKIRRIHRACSQLPGPGTSGNLPPLDFELITARLAGQNDC